MNFLSFRRHLVISSIPEIYISMVHKASFHEYIPASASTQRESLRYCFPFIQLIYTSYLFDE